jgi:opacity protein-like surface antigen
VKLGLDIETSLESRIDPTPYGALVPFPSAPPTRPLTLLTLRSFAGIDKEIDSTVIGVEAGLGYRFTHSARSIGTVPTFGPSGLDASVSARIGTIIAGRLLYGTAGIAVANFTTNTQRLHHDRLYGGLTVGVGLEQHLTPTLLLRAEYFYRQFPAARFQSHNFRIGVGIRF